MRNPTKRIIGCVLLAGSLAGFTSGCNSCCKPGATPGNTGGTTPGNTSTNNTSGSSGSLPVDIGSFSSGNNGQTCFSSADGWDKYYPLPGYLLGPGVTPPNNNPYPNPANLANVTIDTCDPLNGTTLETGVVIMYEFNPAGRSARAIAPPPGDHARRRWR